MPRNRSAIVALQKLEADREALDAFQLCSRLEGIIPALEPSHARSFVGTIIGDMDKDQIVILNMCGRGDKDVNTVAEKLGDHL